jgi:hypothetical protein
MRLEKIFLKKKQENNLQSFNFELLDEGRFWAFLMKVVCTKFDSYVFIKNLLNFLTRGTNWTNATESWFLENRQILVETFSLPIMKQKTHWMHFSIKHMIIWYNLYSLISFFMAIVVFLNTCFEAVCFLCAPSKWLDTTLCLIAYLQDIGHDIRLVAFKPWSNYLTVTYVLNFKNYHHFEGAQRKHTASKQVLRNTTIAMKNDINEYRLYQIIINCFPVFFSGKCWFIHK